MYNPNMTAAFSPRLAEVMSALSIATDLGMGQPMEFALRGCVVSMRLADALGLSDADLHAVYYFSLLRYIGCNADMHFVSAILGDELAFRWDAGLIDNEDPAQVRALIERYVRLLNAGASPSRMAGALATALKAFAELSREIHVGHCEVGERLAQQMGFGAPVIHALGQAYERWDGTGPRAIQSDALAPAVSIVSMIQDALVIYQVSGVEAATHIARERSGTVYAPRHVELFCARAAKLFAGLDNEPVWNIALACEPGARVTLADARFDAACEAMADFADLKSPYLLGHSRGVARLAADAARRFGLPQSETQKIRRAGWLQDIGRAGISAGIWSKAGALTVDEWERVRLHSYFGERVLARSPALARRCCRRARGFSPPRMCFKPCSNRVPIAPHARHTPRQKNWNARRARASWIAMR